MFRFKGNYLQGASNQYLAKITHLIQCGYIEVLQTSVFWLHRMICEACVLCTAHTPYRPYYAAITLTKSVRLLCSHIEPSV
jgi:hypothetical protein